MVFLALLTFLLLLGKVNTWPRARISSEKQSAGKKRFFGEKSVDRQSEVRVAAYQIDSSRFFLLLCPCTYKIDVNTISFKGVVYK